MTGVYARKLVQTLLPTCGGGGQVLRTPVLCSVDWRNVLGFPNVSVVYWTKYSNESISSTEWQTKTLSQAIVHALLRANGYI